MSLLAAHDQEMLALRRGTRRFVVLSIVLLLAVIAAILVRQGLFRPTVSLGFVASGAQDISKGMAVKIAGFRVGSVHTVTLRADGQVDVAMEIDADYLRFVTQDAVAELRHENLVGSPSIEIVPGADKTRLATADARLTFSRAEGLTAIAGQLREDIQPILQDIKKVTAALADPKHGVAATLARLHETTAQAQALLVTGNQQTGQLGDAAGRVLRTADADLQQLGRTLEQTNTQLPVILNKTQRILDHVDTLGANAAHAVPPLLKDGQAVAGDVREIVSGAKQAWPVRNLIAPAGPVHLPADSDPRAEGGQRAR